MQTLTTPVVMATNWRHSLLNDREKTLVQLYAQVYPMVLHYVKQHQGTPEDAQDLLQEAIILFYEKIMAEQLTLTSSATTYLMSICKNQWRQELAKQQRQRKNLPVELTSEEEEPTPDPASPAQDLLRFVARLGQKCQDILVEFYYLGYSMPRIADNHQYRNTHTATVQKFKCLERLRKSMAAYTFTDFN